MRSGSPAEIGDLCSELHDELKATFFELQAIGHAEGKYLFEGEWRTASQMAQLYDELRLRDRRIFVEILLLMLAMAGATLSVILLLLMLIGLI